MEDRQIDNSQWVLSISLDAPKISAERGFSNTLLLKNNGRIEFNCRLDHDQVSVWLIGKAYGVYSVDEIVSWAAEYDPQTVPKWAMRIDGNWLAIVFDRTRNTVNIISDRNGASRVYYVQENGRVVIASSIWGVTPLIKAPKLSSFSAFTLLSTYYTLDPYTLIEGVRVSMPGQSIKIDKIGGSASNYFEQVQLVPEYYEDETECVQEMDAVFQRIFRKRSTADRTPMVLLSGGIDSVTMLKYLSELSNVPVHTLTFSVAGQAQNEHEPARIAAKHFGAVHHELIIDPRQAPALFKQACEEQRTPNVSTLIAIAVENYVVELDGDFDIFSGEDGRVHTPDFDIAKQFSIWLNITAGIPRFPRSQRALAKLLCVWPWYPKNYLRLVASQVKPQNQVKRVFLKHVNKFTVPREFNLDKSVEFKRLLAEIPEFLGNITVSDVFRQNVKLSHRLQHTDNMAVSSSKENSALVKHSPFFDWEAVSVFNRIPFNLGARGVFTIRSWSRFLMVNKKLLRQVLKGAVPDSILYRRKNVASAVDVFVRGGLFNLFEKILNNWYDDYFQVVGLEVGKLSNMYVKEFRTGSMDMRVVYATLSVCYMTLLNQVCLDPKFDIESELSRLNAEIGGMSA